MSLLKEMLLHPKMEYSLGYMEAGSPALSQGSSPVDTQPVSPDVLAKGTEDLLFEGIDLSNVCSKTDKTSKDLFEDLGSIDSSVQGSLLDDFFYDPVDLDDLLNSLLEPSISEPLEDQVPSTLADLSSFDVNLFGHEMEPDVIDSGFASPAVAASPVLDHVALDPAQPEILLSSPEQSHVIMEEHPGMFIELESEDVSSTSVSGESSPLSTSVSSESLPCDHAAIQASDDILMKYDATGQPIIAKQTTARFEPYKRPIANHAGRESKKERKRLQNQQAAVRYRQKKKQESDTLHEQATALIDENRHLSEKADGLVKEIKYMKDLLLEVYKAKGLHKEAKELYKALRG